MSALSRLVNGSNRAEAIDLDELGRLLAGKIDGEVAGLTISQRRALGLAAWFSGVKYLSESVAFRPVHALRKVRGELVTRSLPMWLRMPEAEPSGRPIITRSRLLELWMMSLLHRGNAYGWKLRDSVGRVTGMRYIAPNRVKPRGIVSGYRTFDVDMTGSGQWERTTSFDVFHVVGLSSDDSGMVGLSPLDSHAANLGIAAAADEFAGRYFGQGSMISSWIQLTKPLSRGRAIEDIKSDLDEFYRGIENAHSTAVLSEGAEYKTAQLNAQQAQLLEARGWSVLEISRVLRVPPHKLYDLSRATFSNIEQQSIEAITDGVRPWVERFEDQISSDPDLVPAGSRIGFDLDDMMRGDSKARGDWYHRAIGDGWMTLDEPRRVEGLEPVNGMSVFYRPAQYHTVDADTGRVLIPAGAPEIGTDAGDADDPEPQDAPDTNPATRSNGHEAGTSPAELAEIIGGES